MNTLNKVQQLQQDQQDTSKLIIVLHDTVRRIMDSQNRIMENQNNLNRRLSGYTILKAMA